MGFELAGSDLSKLTSIAEHVGVTAADAAPNGAVSVATAPAASAAAASSATAPKPAAGAVAAAAAAPSVFPAEW